MNGVVLISGSGSNLQSIIDNSKEIDLNISSVISNKADAYGLERAKKANIKTDVIEHNDFNSREEFDSELSKIIDSYNPGIIILAGFMRILTPEFTNKYLGKMLNIHPWLLPKFQGLYTHQRAIDANEKEHGVSVHFVTSELDGGPIIAQRKVEVLPEDDADILGSRVLKEEHILYPEVINKFTQGKLKFSKNKAFLNGEEICI